MHFHVKLDSNQNRVGSRAKTGGDCHYAVPLVIAKKMRIHEVSWLDIKKQLVPSDSKGVD